MLKQKKLYFTFHSNDKVLLLVFFLDLKYVFIYNKNFKHAKKNLFFHAKYFLKVFLISSLKCIFLKSDKDAVMLFYINKYSLNERAI